MRTALVQLQEFNELFMLDEREETKLKDPKTRILMSLSDLQTLGQALTKTFKTATSQREPEGRKQSELRHSVSQELS